MKQETKNLIDWIKSIIKEKTLLYTAFLCASDVVKNERNKKELESQKKKAIQFLDSLPEIEARLCQGGYIQDIDGTPCCNGDSVTQGGMIGNLYWSKQDFCFYLKASDTLYSLHSNFRKVK